MILDMVKNTTEQALISIVIAKVEDIFKNEATGHDASHTIRVYKTAKKLCEGTGANTLIVSLASLLHDVDDVKIFPTHINDEAAREIMFELKINEDEKEQILHIILIAGHNNQHIIPVIFHLLNNCIYCFICKAACISNGRF